MGIVEQENVRIGTNYIDLSLYVRCAMHCAVDYMRVSMVFLASNVRNPHVHDGWFTW